MDSSALTRTPLSTSTVSLGPSSTLLSILVPVPTSTDIEAPLDLVPGLPVLSPAELMEDRSKMIHFSCGATILVSSIAFCGRLYSRHMTQAGILFSDWILLVGTLSSFALASIQLSGTRFGVGRHLQVVMEEDPSLQMLEQALKLIIVASPVYFATITRLCPGALRCTALANVRIIVIKISILTMYYELFGSMWFRRIIWGLGILLVCWFITFTTFSIVTCHPFSGTWQTSVRSAPICTTAVRPAYWTHSLTNILTDAAILLLPLGVIWRLQLRTHDKCALSVIFMLGSISVVASSARFAYTVAQTGRDTTFAYPILAMWTEIEVLVALVAASLTVMRPVFMVTLLPLLRVVSGGRISYTGRSSPRRSRSTPSDRTAGGAGSGPTGPGVRGRGIGGARAGGSGGMRTPEPPHRPSRLSRLVGGGGRRGGGAASSVGSSALRMTEDRPEVVTPTGTVLKPAPAGEELALATWPIAEPDSSGGSSRKAVTHFTSRSESTESAGQVSSVDVEMGRSTFIQDAG